MKLHIFENNGTFTNEDNRLLLVSFKDNSLVVAEYLSNTAAPSPDAVTIPAAESTLATMMDTGPVSDVAHADKNWKLVASAILPSQVPFGADEYSDYSVLDFYSGQHRWVSRFPMTRLGRIRYTERLRNLNQASIITTLVVPFAGDWSTIEAIVYAKSDLVLTDLEIADTVDATQFSMTPTNPAWWDHMWGVAITETSRDADGAINFSAQLEWNRDGASCARVATLWLDLDAGYSPKKMISFDQNGSASFKVIPLGLTAGDKITVKLGANVYSGIGSLTVSV